MTSAMRVGFIARTLLLASLLVGGAGGAAHANGGGGGGGGCPWAKDTSVTVAGREMVIPQSAFDPRSPQLNLEGYEVIPAVNQLVLRFIGPYGDVWESALTRLEAGKRCLAYMIGSPVQVTEALPYAQRRTAGLTRP